MANWAARAPGHCVSVVTLQLEVPNAASLNFFNQGFSLARPCLVECIPGGWLAVPTFEFQMSNRSSILTTLDFFLFPPRWQTSTEEPACLASFCTRALHLKKRLTFSWSTLLSISRWTGLTCVCFKCKHVHLVHALTTQP